VNISKLVSSLQESDLAQADKYAELAMQADRYNPAGKSIALFTKSPSLFSVSRAPARLKFSLATVIGNVKEM
jgi:hypothetical protein